MPPKPRPLRDRFEEQVDRTDESGCWPWMGKISFPGYGRIGADRQDGKNRQLYAHRVAYEFYVGPIPEGMTLDHICRNRACVNPAHLEVVTRGENTRRGLLLRDWNPSSAKTHCPQGHPYDEENTYRTKSGRRLCVICKRESDKRRAKKKRSADPEAYRVYFREYRQKNGERLRAYERERNRQRKAADSSQLAA
jgi:hypothetical protein